MAKQISIIEKIQTISTKTKKNTFLLMKQNKLKNILPQIHREHHEWVTCFLPRVWAGMFLLQGHLPSCHCHNDSPWSHRATTEFHETSCVLNYVLGCSHVDNPLRTRVSNKCMGTHIYIRNFYGKGYLTVLGTIPSAMSLPLTVIALHMCYILVPIALNLLLLGNTFPRSGVLRGTWTFLGLFTTKWPFSP